MVAFVRKLGHAFVRDAIDDVGAMMAYYAILAVFPMLFFVITLAALVIPSNAIAEAARLALEEAPSSARSLVAAQVDAATSHARAGFAFGTLVLALWGASRGASGLMFALNRLFGRVETRSWLHRQAIAIAVTVALATLLLVALGLLVAGPLLGQVVANRFGLGGVFDIVWTVGRWVLAALLVIGVWALAYRFLPDTDAPFHMFTPGTVAGVGLWLAISRLFGLYLDRFGGYSSIYGALGSAVIFLTWLWLSSMSLMLGAEIDAVLADMRRERRTSTLRGT
jgi:membrane protein